MWAAEVCMLMSRSSMSLHVIDHKGWWPSMRVATPWYSLFAVQMQVTALRPGRYYAVRLRCTPVATAPREVPVAFASQCSALQLFRTIPTPPGPMQPPALSQRARNALKVSSWCSHSGQGLQVGSPGLDNIMRLLLHAAA